MLDQPAIQIAFFVLAVVIVLGNTMIMVAFLRGRKGKEESSRRRGQRNMEELHKRVEQLRDRTKN
jgi:hypothetical protein